MVNTVADCTGASYQVTHLLVCVLFIMMHKTMIKEVTMTIDIPLTANPAIRSERHTIDYKQPLFCAYL